MTDAAKRDLPMATGHSHFRFNVVCFHKGCLHCIMGGKEGALMISGDLSLCNIVQLNKQGGRRDSIEAVWSKQHP